MRRSNYERSGSRRTQHSAILIIALVLLFAVIVGGTVALLQATAANRLEREFKPAIRTLLGADAPVLALADAAMAKLNQ